MTKTNISERKSGLFNPKGLKRKADPNDHLSEIFGTFIQSSLPGPLFLKKKHQGRMHLRQGAKYRSRLLANLLFMPYSEINF